MVLYLLLAKRLRTFPTQSCEMVRFLSSTFTVIPANTLYIQQQ